MTAADANIAAARRLLADFDKGRKVSDDMARVLRRVTDAADWVNAGRRDAA